MRSLFQYQLQQLICYHTQFVFLHLPYIRVNAMAVSRPKQSGRYFEDELFKCIPFKGNFAFC